MSITINAGADDGGRRLDRVLRKAFPDLPLSLIHRLLRSGSVLLDGNPARAPDRVNPGSTISLPDIKDARRYALPRPASRTPDILREGAGLLILNKAPGMAVHGPGSLAVQAAAWLSGKISPSLSFRPGPLHRLDKPTSGIVVFSMNLEGARRFSALLRDGSVKKSYLALVDGTIREPLVWEDRLFREKDVQKTFVSDMTDKTGKYAFTAVRPLARAAGRAEYSLILAEIATGRTHQIRAQAAAHGFPLSGDGKYGGSPLEGGLLLHAWTLDFPEGEGRTHIEAPLPERFRKKIETLFPGFRLPQSPAVPCTMPPPAL